MRAISVASVVLLFLSSSVMIAHLGMKPVSGGRPPSDNRTNGMGISSIGDLFHVMDNEEMEVRELVIIGIKADVVIIM